ncbi:MAG TPA: hypothetical protein DCS93_11130 [Microscillaceae bacterium]|nr:hypothetical protein [Microscillaceae bacterium]
MLDKNKHIILKDHSLDANHRILTVRMKQAVSPGELRTTLNEIIEEELSGNYTIDKHTTYTDTMHRVSVVRKS